MPLITPGQSIQAAVNANPAGTAFCLGAGLHEFGSGKPNTTSVQPKSGNTFTGQYGAILDGTAWTTSDIDAAAFKAIDNGITNVAIRNLEIRNMPSYGVNGYLSASNWLAEYLNIHHCRTGIATGHYGTVQHCFLHHNTGVFNHPDPAYRGGGYIFSNVIGVSFLDNEVSYNGQEQKFGGGTLTGATNLTVKNNWFHHNVFGGFWIDGNGNGSIIESNTCEDHSGGPGITLELGWGVIVRNNVCRRNTGGEGILLSLSRDCEVTGNTLDGNLFGVGLFIDCVRLTEGEPWNPDLLNVNVHHNTIIMPSGLANSYAAILSVSGGCGAPYYGMTKNLQFDYNAYTVPGPNTYPRWFWGANKTWAQWQGLPLDTHSTVSFS